MIKAWNMRALIFLLSSMLVANMAVAQGVDNKQPVAVEADSMEVLQGEQRAIFQGNVLVEQGTMKLRTDKLVIAYNNSDQSAAIDQGSIRKIDAYGNVIVVTPTETARGDTGVYDVVRGFITLNGNVVLTRDDNLIKGSSMVMDLNTGKSSVKSGKGTGRVKGIFAPSSQ